MINERKKICFLLVAHYPFDERVWYHQRESLINNGFSVSIISTRLDYSNLQNVYCFDDTNIPKSTVYVQIERFFKSIIPDIIICDNPLAVFFANKYKKKFDTNCKIIIDITEFYPSKKNLYNIRFFRRIFKKIILHSLNIYSGFVSDAFIFGEFYKARMYRLLFYKKNYIYLPYYPNLKYFNHTIRKLNFSTIKMLYCGNLNEDKGFGNLLTAIKYTLTINQQTNFILTIITNDKVDDKYSFYLNYLPENLTIIFEKYKPFELFCSSLTNYDIFFDLRKNDRENTLCLPIKLFYYAAAGKVSIYSNLKAIRKQIADFDSFGYLVNPRDFQSISKIISDFITDNSTYQEKCSNALRCAHSEYNWNNIELKFINFIINELKQVKK